MTDDDDVDVDVDLGPDDPGVVEAPALADGADAVSSRFSLAYLEDLLRPVPADAEVDLAVGDGMPAELRWRVGGAAGTVLYRLAPRLDRGR